jgi:flagellar biosynthesis chaperone FliJ
MAFRFPLATVLRVKESLEKREERALQRIQLEMARVTHQMEELAEAMTRAYAVRNRALQQAMPAGQLHTMLWEAQAAVEAKSALRITLQELEEPSSISSMSSETRMRWNRRVLSRNISTTYS